jgi:chromosome partitioning protein
VLVNFYENRTNETRESIVMLENTFRDRLLSPIHQATVLRECASEGHTIFEKSPSSRSAQEYEQLVNCIIKS